ncbi:MAG TPA: LLM class flavin-dependent oxidoreductase, partial [Acidimicrobiales bacterium]|nr:LLM class flavin-dependent oxidoreductase [Acidimicrobiales bacterium]
MRLGLVHINMGAMSRPDGLAQAARAAEAAGFDSLWAGEHVVLPDPQVPPSPVAPGEPMLDSLLALSWAAAHT